MNEDIYSQLLRAARWSELNHEIEVFVPTAPVLYRLAAEYQSGMLDLSKLPERTSDEDDWSGMMARLEKIGIDVHALSWSLEKEVRSSMSAAVERASSALPPGLLLRVDVKSVMEMTPVVLLPFEPVEYTQR